MVKRWIKESGTWRLRQCIEWNCTSSINTYQMDIDTPGTYCSVHSGSTTHGPLDNMKAEGPERVWNNHVTRTTILRALLAYHQEIECTIFSHDSLARLSRHGYIDSILLATTEDCMTKQKQIESCKTIASSIHFFSPSFLFPFFFLSFFLQVSSWHVSQFPAKQL